MVPVPATGNVKGWAFVGEGSSSKTKSAGGQYLWSRQRRPYRGSCRAKAGMGGTSTMLYAEAGMANNLATAPDQASANSAGLENETKKAEPTLKR
jgi:hypothetical protein